MYTTHFTHYSKLNLSLIILKGVLFLTAVAITVYIFLVGKKMFSLIKVMLHMYEEFIEHQNSLQKLAECQQTEGLSDHPIKIPI